MPKNRGILEMHDQRNEDQLHQQHRHDVRAAKKRNQTTLHHSSHSTERPRSSTRSWKRNQLITISNSYEVDLFDWDDTDMTDDIVHSYDRRKKSRKYTVKNAISNNDADSLASLLGELKMGNKRRQIRHPHTILTHAIDRENFECIRIILDNVFCGKIYSTIIDHVCSNGRTALWYACRKGNLSLVRELVERGRANINRCGVLIVAAQNGHAKIVDYLLRKGCDPNRHTKNYNERALHAASRRNHLGIVNVLLKHGADPTILDYKTRTLLDYAIHKRHIEIAKILIGQQGGRFIMNGTGFTPLMLAVHCNNTRIVDLISSILTRQQVLDELRLLACKYTIDNVVNKPAQAYSYFEKALSAATSFCKSEPCEAYEFLTECQTLNELTLIRENDNVMRMYALLVGERLLLKSGNVDHIVSLITKFYKQPRPVSTLLKGLIRWLVHIHYNPKAITKTECSTLILNKRESVLRCMTAN